MPEIRDPYLRRIVDDLLDERFPYLPAVALKGPRAVGKTTTALRRAQTVFRLDVPTDRNILEADPQLIESQPTPVLLDEWQRLPGLWDVVRRAVDAHPVGGRFLLTGSVPPITTPVHSGAGRITAIRIRPLSLAERQIGPTTVSLGDLLRGADRVTGRTSIRLQDYVREILQSGFPAIRGLPESAALTQLDGYIDATVNHDLVEGGHRVRKPATLRAWLTAFAAATATDTSYTRILDAATPGEDNKPSRVTEKSYRDILTQMGLIDELPPWIPTESYFAQLVRTPRHHLADPALAARLLKMTNSTLLRSPLLGALFESLITLSVRVYAQRWDAEVYFVRDKKGHHEIDLLIEGRDGGIVAFEVKLAQDICDADVAHLHWLRAKLGDRIAAVGILTTGEHAYRRRDGVAVIPAGLLGP